MAKASFRQTVRQLPKDLAQSLLAVLKLLYFRPAYLFLALAVSVVFYEIVFWFLNIGLFQYLLTTEYLTVFDKLDVIIGSYAGIFTTPIAPLALILFVVSIVQGATVAAIVYSIKKDRSVNKRLTREFGGAGAAGVLSVLGLGCSACGTSLVTPILTFFFATSSVAVADQVGFYSAVLALVVSLIALYLAGQKLRMRLTV